MVLLSHSWGASPSDVGTEPVVAAPGSCEVERVGAPGPVAVAGSDERWAAGCGAAEEVRVATGRVDVDRGVAERAVVGVGRE